MIEPLATHPSTEAKASLPIAEPLANQPMTESKASRPMTEPPAKSSRDRAASQYMTKPTVCQPMIPIRSSSRCLSRSVKGRRDCGVHSITAVLAAAYHVTATLASQTDSLISRGVKSEKEGRGIIMISLGYGTVLMLSSHQLTVSVGVWLG